MFDTYVQNQFLQSDIFPEPLAWPNGNYTFRVKPVVTAHRFSDPNLPLEDIIDAEPLEKDWCNKEIINLCWEPNDGICD